MAANGSTGAGAKHPDGYWGKWRGVTCSIDGCDLPARCKGMCDSHYSKARWAEGYRPPSVNAASRRRAHLKHRYRLTDEEVDFIIGEQRGACAICGELPSDSNTRAHWNGKLCVDHDHDTGKVRGLLCNDCNLTVGYGKSPEVLRAAAEYLERFA